MALGTALNATSFASAATFSQVTLAANTTIAVWLYFTGSITNINCLFGGDVWYHGNGGKLVFRYNNAQVCYTSTTNVSNDAAWHLYVITDNGSVIKGYKDNVDMGNSTPYSTISGCPIVKFLQHVNGNAYVGLIDEVCIWNRALSSGELSTLYGGGSPPAADLGAAPWNSGLMAGWHFDTFQAMDFSHNGHDVTFSSVSFATGIVPENVPLCGRSRVGAQCVVGALKGITLGGPTSYLGDDTFSRHMQTGVREELVDGYPSPPCLALDYPGFWRFRWQLAPGTQTISVWAKQVSNVTGKRPQMIVKANPAIGVAADVVGTAASSTGWTKIGPIGVTASAAGVVWVELWNKDTDTFYSTSYFDTIGS